MNSTTTVLANKYISVRMINDDEGYLMNSENGDVFEINSTTKLIFDLISEKMAIDQIYETLREKADDASFDVTKQDILDIVLFFVENHICIEEGHL